MRKNSSTISQNAVSDLSRAFSTYLNVTGPGDYNLNISLGQKNLISTKRNAPMFSISSKTQIPYFPQL